MAATRVEIPKQQDWVSCKDRLPVDGVDDNNKFIVAVRQRWHGEKEWKLDYNICEWRDDGHNYPEHDGQRVISYHFDFDWDIDEGQEIEITHWREIPEFKGLEGEDVNLSRCTHEYWQY